jgi:hypothetical protein
MSLLNDHAGLAAVVLTRMAAEEAEGPNHLTGRMRGYVADLVERIGPGAATYLATALARQHFTTLDTLATVQGTSSNELLDALELEQLEVIEEGTETPMPMPRRNAAPNAEWVLTCRKGAGSKLSYRLVDLTAPPKERTTA